MAIELLAAWGVTQAAGFLLKPVMEDLAKDAVKDIFKDKIKDSFGSVFKGVGRDTITKAYGKAVKELLQLIQDELIANDIAESKIEAWNDDIKLFVKSSGVQQAIRDAFTQTSAAADAGLLAQSWQQMPGPHPLPAEFSWSRIAKLFGKKVRNIREQEKELREVLLAQATAETTEAVQNQTGVAPDFDLEKYRESLLESHQHLKLELLDHTGSSYKVQLRSVFVPQTVRDCQEYVPQVFEIPKEYLARLRKVGGLDEAMLELAEGMQEELIDTRRRSYLDQSPRSVLEVIKDDRLPHLVILGSPGSGKSTLLKALALEWAQMTDATERAARPVPLFIELNRYNQWPCPNGKSFVQFLHNGSVVCRLNEQKLDAVLKRRGGAVLLLDGLDEIFDQNQRDEVISDIHRFSNDYPNTPIIVTSRIIGYQQRRLSDAGFRHFMLQDLEDDQITEFLNRWHQTFLAEGLERDTKRQRLAQAIQNSPAIRELADNPLLLTMMSILNLHQELPRDRVQLYEQASRVLLHQWDVERLGLKVTIDYKEKAEMLRRLALEMQSAPGGLKGNFITGDRLEAIFRDYFKQERQNLDAHLAAKEMVQQLRERNYILCLLGQDNFAFVHRTLLEYFCASALVRQSLKPESGSSIEYLKREVFGNHWRDEVWHEVLRLIAGMDDQMPVERVAEIIDFLLAEKDDSYEFHNIFLAAQCCLEARNPRTLGATRTRVCDALLELVQFEVPHSYKEDEDENTRRVNEFYRRTREEGLQRDIRSKAVRFLANPHIFDQAHSWIKEHAKSDADWAVRQASVHELARRLKSDPSIFPLLKDLAVADNNENVRLVAIQELAQGWKEDTEIVLFIEKCLSNRNNWSIQKDIVAELRGFGPRAKGVYFLHIGPPGGANRA